MEDRTFLTNNHPKNGISETFREFIGALVEEVVINGEPFDAQKKWLRKNSEAEGLSYETIESNLNDLFEAIKELEEHESKSTERFARNLAQSCYFSETEVDKLIDNAAAVRVQKDDDTINTNWSSVFIEQLRQAYCRKDLSFLEDAISSNAQILTGAFEKNKNDIRYRTQGKQQYLANLKYIFGRNKTINVQFETDGFTGTIYSSVDGRCQAVRLLQWWYSDNYSDVGYILLLLYADEDGPRVYFRAWQPEIIGGRHITAQELKGIDNIKGLIKKLCLTKPL